MATGNFQRVAGDPDTYAERLLDRTDMPIILAQQFGEKPLIVEMKLERIFSDWL